MDGDTRALIKTGAIAGATAAAINTATAAIASAADVSLEVDGKAIPVAAFAMWTIVSAAIGVGLARLLRTRRGFVIVTAVATALTLIPAITAPDDTATKLVLVSTHLIAAAITIPALARHHRSDAAASRTASSSTELAGGHSTAMRSARSSD